jgi:hypothetical protein
MLTIPKKLGLKQGMHFLKRQMMNEFGHISGSHKFNKDKVIHWVAFSFVYLSVAIKALCISSLKKFTFFNRSFIIKEKVKNGQRGCC